jgi:multiple sugar transport system substrate-binding protein
MHEPKKEDAIMLKSIKKTLLGAVLVAGVSVPHAFAETTLNALFMAQAAYSEADVRAMTDAFTKANPDVKVNLEFVPYEGLHDKAVLAQGFRQRLRRRAVRRDLAGRIRDE